MKMLSATEMAEAIGGVSGPAGGAVTLFPLASQYSRGIVYGMVGGGGSEALEAVSHRWRPSGRSPPVGPSGGWPGRRCRHREFARAVQIE